MNYTYLSWSSVAVSQAKKTINYGESVSLCNIVSECLNVEKQEGKAHLHPHSHFIFNHF